MNKSNIQQIQRQKKNKLYQPTTVYKLAHSMIFSPKSCSTHTRWRAKTRLTTQRCKIQNTKKKNGIKTVQNANTHNFQNAKIKSHQVGCVELFKETFIFAWTLRIERESDWIDRQLDIWMNAFCFLCFLASTQ